MLIKIIKTYSVHNPIIISNSIWAITSSIYALSFVLKNIVLLVALHILDITETAFASLSFNFTTFTSPTYTKSCSCVSNSFFKFHFVNFYITPLSIVFLNKWRYFSQAIDVLTQLDWKNYESTWTFQPQGATKFKTTFSPRAFSPLRKQCVLGFGRCTHPAIKISYQLQRHILLQHCPPFESCHALINCQVSRSQKTTEYLAFRWSNH